MDSKRTLYCKVGIPEYWIVDPKTGAITLYTLVKGAYEQLSVDPKGFIKSPLLKRKLRIVVKPWTFEILEA
jgi:Uma2 family endonuclease